MFVYFSVPTFVAFLKEVESPYEVRLQDVCFKYFDNNHLFSLKIVEYLPDILIYVHLWNHKCLQLSVI